MVRSHARSPCQSCHQRSPKPRDAGFNGFPGPWRPGLDPAPQMDTHGTGMMRLQEMETQTFMKASQPPYLSPALSSDLRWTSICMPLFKTTVERGGKMVGIGEADT